MKAGRELDALIAEKVMGLVLTCPVDPRFDHSVGTNRDGTSAKRNFCRWPDGKEWWIPFYSTSIADAWQVVEKMKEHGMHLLILSANDSGMVHCNFFKGTAGEQNGIAMADTAPLAICKAALVACGVEVDA